MFSFELDKFENIGQKNIVDIVTFIRQNVEKNFNRSVQTISIGRLNNQYRIEILAFEKPMPSPILREIDKKFRFYTSIQSDHLKNEICLNKFILQAFTAIKSISVDDKTFIGVDCDVFYNYSDEEILKELLEYIGFNPLEGQYK